MIPVDWLSLIPPGNELNNRELATVIWLVIAAAFVLWRKEARPLLASLVRFATSRVIVITTTGLWCWTAVLVLVASRLHLWTGDLLKDTMIWLIGAFGLFFGVTKLSNDPQFFRRIGLNTVRAGVLVDFYINLRVLSLPVEFILIPTVTFMALLAVTAGADPKNQSVKTLVNVVISAAGIALLAYVTIALIGGWGREDLGHDLRDLALPVWLTVGILPYLYGLSLFVGYQSQFLRMDFWTRGDLQAGRRAKFALLVELNIRTHLVNGLAGHWFNDLAQARTLSEARAIVRRYRLEVQGSPNM